MNTKGREIRCDEFAQCIEDAEKIIEKAGYEVERDNVIKIALALWKQ